MFRRKTRLPPLLEQPADLPDGIMLHVDEQVYYKRAGKLYRVPSDRVAQSWSCMTIPATPAAIARYRVSGAPLGFRDGTLINNIADGKLYLVSAGKRRLVASPDVLTRLGLTARNAVLVSSKEAQMHEEGESIV